MGGLRQEGNIFHVFTRAHTPSGRGAIQEALRRRDGGGQDLHQARRHEHRFRLGPKGWARKLMGMPLEHRALHRNPLSLQSAEPQLPIRRDRLEHCVCRTLFRFMQPRSHRLQRLAVFPASSLFFIASAPQDLLALMSNLGHERVEGHGFAKEQAMVGQEGPAQTSGDAVLDSVAASGWRVPARGAAGNRFRTPRPKSHRACTSACKEVRRNSRCDCNQQCSSACRKPHIESPLLATMSLLEFSSRCQELGVVGVDARGVGGLRSEHPRSEGDSRTLKNFRILALLIALDLRLVLALLLLLACFACVA